MNTPEGWKLVPVEPTQEIAQALDLPRFPFSLEYNPERWRAALAAAPTPPAPKCAELHDLEIRGIALDCGFKLKPQPDGTEDLNPYVYQFAREILATMPSVEEVAAFAQAMAKRKTPPAQEDEPVYQLRFDGNTWFDTPKEQYDYFTSKEREVKSDARILYTRPQSDELRRAAEEMILVLDGLSSADDGIEILFEIGEPLANLRAALKK
jgi:hypothetical protein